MSIYLKFGNFGEGRMCPFKSATGDSPTAVVIFSCAFTYISTKVTPNRIFVTSQRTGRVFLE
jgi:hypothetical protein